MGKDYVQAVYGKRNDTYTYEKCSTLLKIKEI